MAIIRQKISWNFVIDKAEYPIQHQPVDHKDPILQVLPDGRKVIGYLAYQGNMDNPLEGVDGMGFIYDARHEPRPAREAAKKPWAVMLNVYSHGGEAWSVAGSATDSFPDEDWDVSRGAGIWVPDDMLTEQIESEASDEDRRKAALKYAGQAVEDYNKWLAGDYCGICVEVYDKNNNLIEEDEVEWHMLGQDEAEKELAALVKAKVSHLTT